MAVVANQAAGVDKSMLTVCRRIGDVPVRSGCFGRIARYFGHRRLKAGVRILPYRSRAHHRCRHPETLVGVLKYLLAAQRSITGDSEADRLVQWAESAKPQDYVSVVGECNGDVTVVANRSFRSSGSLPKNVPNLPKKKPLPARKIHQLARFSLFCCYFVERNK